MINKLANTANGNGNLVDEFEEAFQTCLNILTKDDALTNMDKDEIRAEVDQSMSRVIDLARQTEGYFLQKRFLLSALKPELIVKEDISDLRSELLRKDELIKKHYDKINQWQNHLMDVRCAHLQGQLGQAATVSSMAQQGQLMGQPNGMPQGAPPMAPGGPGGSIPGNLQQLQQQQQIQMQQQMQQQQQQQPQPPPPQQQQMQMQQQMQHQQMQQMQMQQQVQGMGSPQQAMFMGSPSRASFQPSLQGPLAYLVKTTSNIGMTDGRR